MELCKHHRGKAGCGTGAYAIYEGLLDRFVALTSGVFPDNQELEDRVFDIEAGEVGKDSTSFLSLENGQRSQSSVKQVACAHAPCHVGVIQTGHVCIVLMTGLRMYPRSSWTLKSHLADT